MLEELNIMKLNFEVKHRFDFSGTLRKYCEYDAKCHSLLNFVSKTNKQTNTLLSIKTHRRTEKSSLICYND